MKHIASPSTHLSPQLTVTTENVLQALMNSFGWHDMSSEIREAEQEQQIIEQLRLAATYYLEEPSFFNKNQLIIALNIMLENMQKEYNDAISQQKKYEKQIKIEMAKQIEVSDSYLSASVWSRWLFTKVKNFFGSTHEQQAQKYKEIAMTRQKILRQLSLYLQQLAIIEEGEIFTEFNFLETDTVDDEKNHIELTTYQGFRKFSSSVNVLNKKQHSDPPLPQFPSVIQLSTLNIHTGFKIVGETEGDWSGYSVNAAGDINGDGWDDIILGACQYYTGGVGGISYIVFGGSEISNSLVFNLSSLNGTNGCKFYGENPYDHSGSTVSSAKDINGDGYTDFVIGAWSYPGNAKIGRSYVVFGGPEICSKAILTLSSLDGRNGFKLEGENNHDESGYVAAGDINGDNYTDIIIGAGGYPGGVERGRSYVYLGESNINRSEIIYLSSLNGTNGFKLDGENDNDVAGVPSVIGDINGDGTDDLLIGAEGYPGGVYRGCGYVIFGGSWMIGNEIIYLSDLNGTHGFKINGKNNNDFTGYSVGAAGDINSDGYDDLFIGALGSHNYTGSSYLIFGEPKIGSSGELNLYTLDGSNGCELIGENPYDASGMSVGSAGDFNGDGIDDMILGSFNYSMFTSRGYIIFGSRQGFNNATINLSSLDGIIGVKFDGENQYDHSANFMSPAGDINKDGLADILIGAFNYSVGRGGVYVVFGDAPPVLVNNSLVLSVGAAVVLNSNHLAAYDRNHNNNTLVFVTTGMTHGIFEAVDAPGIALANFTQQQVINSMIRFVHDGSLEAPKYSVTVRSDGIAWAGPSPAQIYFTTTAISNKSLTTILLAVVFSGIFGILGLYCYFKNRKKICGNIPLREQTQELITIPDESRRSINSDPSFFSERSSRNFTNIDQDSKEQEQNELYLVSVFNKKECQKMKIKKGVILTNQNIAYFIEDNEIDEKCIKDINRQDIPLGDTIQPKKCMGYMRQKEKIVKEVCEKGEQLLKSGGSYSKTSEEENISSYHELT